MNTQNSVTDIDCQTIGELIPDYAFGLTSPEESRLIESGLADCPEAAAQLADFRQIQTTLQSNVPQLPPSPQLRDRLMAAAAADIQAARPRRRIIHPAWYVAAAALLVVIITNAYWFTRLNTAAPATTDIAQPVNVQGNTTFVVNPANALRWVHLPSAGQNSTASAVLMWNAQSEIGLLYVSSLTNTAIGKTYQLWLTNGAIHLNAGTFTVDQDGKASLLFHISQPIDQYTWARITEQPSNNGDSFNGSVVVIGKLS